MTTTTVPPVLKIYWTDIGAGKIQRSDLDGSDVEDLVVRTSRTEDSVSDFRGPQGLAIDPVAAKMYWVNIDPDEPGNPDIARIQRANLDGSAIEDVITTEQDGPRDIAFGGSTIYWFNRHVNDLRQAGRDGSNIRTVINLNFASSGDHIGIAADTTTDTLYLATGDMILRLDLVTRTSERLVADRSLVRGIALDIPAAKMYWADGGADKLQRANLDGTDVEDVVVDVLNPQRVALDLTAGKIYWTDSGPRYGASDSRIQRADLDGSNVETLISGLDLPQGIAIAPDLPPSPLPLPPSDLTATAVSPFRINLSWTDESDNEDGFEIERSTPDPGGPFSFLTNVGPDVTTHPDGGLAPDTQYCYRVRAFNMFGVSAWTNIACDTTFPIPTTTLPPTTTTAVPPTTSAPLTTTTVPPTTTTGPPEPDVDIWGDPCDCNPSSSICDPTDFPTFQLEIAVEGNGIVIPDPGRTTRTAGELVRLTAIPDDGWAFLTWRTSGLPHSIQRKVPPISNSTDPSLLHLMEDDILVTAVFVLV